MLQIKVLRISTYSPVASWVGASAIRCAQTSSSICWNKRSKRADMSGTTCLFRYTKRNRVPELCLFAYCRGGYTTAVAEYPDNVEPNAQIIKAPAPFCPLTQHVTVSTPPAASRQLGLSARYASSGVCGCATRLAAPLKKRLVLRAAPFAVAGEILVGRSPCTTVSLAGGVRIQHPRPSIPQTKGGYPCLYVHRCLMERCQAIHQEANAK